MKPFPLILTLIMLHVGDCRWSQMQAGEPELVFDATFAGGGLQSLMAGSNQAFFSTITVNEGHEVWVSDGTLLGTRILRDIAPGRANAGPALIKNIGARTWFTASTAEAGREPWVSDGTGAGTFPLGDLQPGFDGQGDPRQSFAGGFTDIGNDLVVFVAYTSEGSVLYRSDGTAGSAVRVKVLVAGATPPGLINPGLPINAGARIPGTNTALICADSKVFKTDGTSAGTTELSLPAGGPVPTTALSGCGGVFLAGAAATTFYWTDGTSSNTRILDGGGFVRLPAVVVGERLLFIASADVKSTDGTQGGMLTLSTTMTPRSIMAANGFYWVIGGNSLTPPSLHRSDGTAAGTTTVTQGSIFFGDLPSLGGTAGQTWFLGSQTINGKEDRQLYRTDGSTVTRLVVYTNPDTLSPNPGLTRTAEMVAVGGHVFISDRGRLIGYDAATGETVELSNTRASTASGFPQLLHPFQDGFLFWADNTGSRLAFKPWFFRPDSGQDPVILSTIRADGGAASLNFPHYGPFFATDTYAIFAASDRQSPGGPAGIGMELWITEGTPASTRLLKDINPGPDSGFVRALGLVPGSRTNLILQGNFSSVVGNSELLVTDGTNAGTLPLKDINPGNPGSFPFWPTDMGTYWLFNATTATHGRELWRSDGTSDGTYLVKDINPGTSNSINPFNAPIQWPRIGNTAFFTANDGVHGIELWRTDGTAAGTLLVKDINPGSGSSSPLDLVVFDGKLFFVATTAAHGRELWVSDGTADGTTMVKDIRPGSASSITSPNFGYGFLTVSGGRLWFVADDGIHGLELWVSDGTTVGTFLFRDIKIGPLGSDPYGLIDVAGVLCFAADDGTSGVELWQTDGTPGRTFLAGDINTGPASSFPFYRDPSDGINYQVRPDAVVRNGTLYFSARAASVGRELWRYTPARTSVSGGVIGFSSSSYTVGETSGNAIISLVRDGGEGIATVTVRTVAGGTATAGSDYVATSGQVTFLAGETAKTFIVPIINDGTPELAETVLLSLSDPTGGAVLGLAAATLTISDGGSPNQAPSATPQTLTTPKNTPRSFVLSGSDPEGSPVSVASVGLPSVGTLSGSGSQRSFTPPDGFLGTATIGFTVTDGLAVSAPATITITVLDVVNQAPVAQPLTLATAMDTPLDIVLGGSDPEGSAIFLAGTTAPTNGQLLGSGTTLIRTFVPAPGFTGSATFTYTVSDGSAISAPATVTIVVGSVVHRSIRIVAPGVSTWSLEPDSGTTADDHGATVFSGLPAAVDHLLAPVPSAGN